MWFRFPENVGGISVAGQEFKPEVQDDAGRKYFRAPDHFAPQILGEEGFAATAPPETDLPDLPKADPARDSAIVMLQTKVDALTMERDGLQAENASLKVQLEAAQTPAAETVVEEEISSNGKKK